MNLSWEMLWGLGALLLLAGLVYGFTQYKRRNRANDAVTEAATRAEYSDPEGYPQRREELKKDLRPS